MKRSVLLFAGLFPALSAVAVVEWTSDDSVSIKEREGIAHIALKKASGEGWARKELPFDPSWRSKCVILELDVRNPGALASGSYLRVAQFDAGGKRLSESLTDPRFLSFLRPGGVTQRMRERGRIHPQAVRLVLECRLQGVRTVFDDDGQPLADPASAFPRLDILHAAVRPETPADRAAPNRDLYTSGVTGAAGDAALDLRAGRALFYATRSQAAWAEGVQERSPAHIFWPTGAGTVEAWLRPEWPSDAEKPLTVFEAANHLPPRPWSGSRKELFSVTYHPGKKTLALLLKDEADRAYRISAPAAIPAGVWSHVAAVWTPGGHARLFLNGRPVAEMALKGYQPIDLTADNAKVRPNERGPTEFYLGGHYLDVRSADGLPPQDRFLHGAVDQLRVSSVARYDAPFTPAKAFSPDSATRALFGFDMTCDGVSGGGIGFVSASILAAEPRTLSGGPVVPPREPFSSLNFVDLPTPDDYAAARRTVRERFTLAPGERRVIQAPARVYPDFVEIANRGDKPLLFPFVRRSDEVDPRSFRRLRETLALDGHPDRRKADRVFNWVLGVQDYFMADSAVFYPGKDRPESFHNDPLMQLNAYPGCSCGGLNYIALHLFACSADLPATAQGGYGHLFEQVWYDGTAHLYDVSWQQYCPSFDGTRAVRLDEIEREPGLMRRLGRSVGHYIRLSTRSAIATSPRYRPIFGVSLNPGERFRWWFANNGRVMDTAYFGGAYRPHPLTRDVTAETGAKTRGVQRQNRFFPEAATGLLVFDGRPRASNPAFGDVRADSFVYRVDTRYPVTYAEYAAEGVSRYGLSTDGGKNWRTFPADASGRLHLDYPVRGRPSFLVRVHAPIAAVRRFRAVTTVQMNPRVLTGRLRPGANGLIYTNFGGGAADVTVQYRTPATPLVVSGGVRYGTIPGEERQMVLVDPARPLELAVSGAAEDAEVAVSDSRLSARLAAGHLTLSVRSAVDAGPFFATVVIRSGSAQKEVVALVAANARLATEETAELFGGAERLEDAIQPTVMMRTRGAGARFKFAPLPAGRYMVFNVQRHPGALRDVYAKRLTLEDPAAKTARERFVRAGGGRGASDYYKARYGRPEARGPFKWDYPTGNGTGYPLAMAETFDWPVTEQVTLRCAVDDPAGSEVAAVLVLPEPDYAFYGELIKELSGLNYAPTRVKE